MNNGIIRLDKTYSLTNLPQLKSNMFGVNGQIGYTGSIIRRDVKGTLGIYKHYAMIYGFDMSGNLLLIENNINGVECITYRDFLQGGTTLCKMHFYNTDPKQCESIMKRAAFISMLPYDKRTNNCEHFVNYSVNGKRESIQVTRSEGVANLLFSFSELVAHNNPNIKDLILKSIGDARIKLNLKRPESIQKVLDSLNTSIKESTTNQEHELSESVKLIPIKKKRSSTKSKTSKKPASKVAAKKKTPRLKSSN